MVKIILYMRGNFYGSKIEAFPPPCCRSIDTHPLLEFFNIQETDLLPVIGKDAFNFQLVDHSGDGLPAAADQTRDVFMSEEIGNTEAFGGILSQVLFHQLPQEMDQAGLYIFIEQVEEPV